MSESHKFSVVPGDIRQTVKIYSIGMLHHFRSPTVLLHATNTVWLPAIFFPVQTACGRIPVLNS